MAAAVSADQECEDGRGEDGAGPPEQISFPKLPNFTKTDTEHLRKGVIHDHKYTIQFTSVSCFL